MRPLDSQELYERGRRIASELKSAGATDCVMVGGYVRDSLLGLPCKDMDLEVYGLSYDQIVKALSQNHQVNLVGQAFGIVLVDGRLDVSIPRRESKVGVGHRGFATESDPNMTPKEAALRRDFTVNAIAQRFDGEFVDPFNGRADLEDGILRATSKKFREDPLRVLRGMQFVSRFGFEMDSETVSMCRDLQAEFSTLSPERVYDEWAKWARGNSPGKGLEILKKTAWLEGFSCLKAIDGLPQDPDWHPEGDVLTHTAHVCDAAAEIANRDGLPENDRMILFMSALLHDVGKAGTTVKNEAGRWISPGHADAGVPLSEEFLKNLKAPHWLVDHVRPLVREHMVPMSIGKGEKPSAKSVRRLARRLEPSSISMLALLCEADHNGRPPKRKGKPLERWMGIATEESVEASAPDPILLGRHLLERPELGFEPGPEMGRVLKAAYEAQLDGYFADLDEAIEWVKRKRRCEL
ncbi:MAG: HD domain-containing protein [Planctomycetota bacterium]|nr:HD domain-containing protein [Planctomycetota bacterium]